VGDLALLLLPFVSACTVGAKANVPNVGGNYFLKCAVEKFLKPCVGLRVGKLDWVCVKLQRIVNRVMVVSESKVWSFWCPPDGYTVVFRLAYNVFGAGEGKDA
jgi:hypothetical protein